MLNFKFFFCPAMCWHATLTLTLIHPHLVWMWCEFEFYLTLNMLGWTLITLMEIYFISFGYTPIVIYFRILPCELIDSLLMGQVSGQAIAYVPYILSWGSHCVIIHRFNQTWDASNGCISFIFFCHSSNVWMPSRIINDWIHDCSFTVQWNDSLWNFELTLMKWAERERFCGVLLSCCPTLCFTKYLVSSVSNHKWFNISN